MPLNLLTTLQWNILRALINRIIPPDDFPGAWEAGVGDYLARQFELDLRPQLGIYRLGLEALEAETHVSMGTGFAELDSQAQDELLSRIETGQIMSLWPVDPAEFFRTVTEHVMEGYYSDPGNGGNRDSMAWRMIGFEA